VKANLAKLGCPFRSESGATIVEAIVAIGIAGVIITAIMAMVVTAINTSDLSKSRTTATNYANEGAEIARSVRDSMTWGSFFANYVSPGTVCSTCQVTSAGGLAISGVSISPYTRTVLLSDGSPVGSPQSRVTVDVTVTWSNHGKTEKVELVSYLTDWHK
jgi:Tfp pilus assembly protein PilV